MRTPDPLHIAWRQDAFEDGDTLAVSRQCHWWNPRTWFSWRIKATTRSPWNHVGLLKWDAHLNHWRVIEALFWGGVVSRPMFQVLGQDARFAVARIDSPPAARRTAARWAANRVGYGYNRRRILQIRLLQIALGAKKVGGLSVAGQAPQDSFICSELVIGAHRAGGYPLEGCGPFAGPASVMSSPSGSVVWDTSGVGRTRPA